MKRHALLVYPEFPLSYWGYQHALKFVGKKSAIPPLGLLTVAGLFPSDYQLRVVDMNTTPLRDADLEWADLVFTSTMVVQKDSLQTVIKRCNQRGIPVIAGGPHPTTFHDEIQGVSHFVLGEVEEIFADFLRDLENGTAKAVYCPERRPDISKAPIPRYDLIRLQDYTTMALQFSRGCPFDCEFCDITKLFGRIPRTKTSEQMLAEFEFLYRCGWRGSLFLVDDNFIGNKREAMRLLPEIAQWQKARGYPFTLHTEASVNLAEMEPLMDAMVDAGFNMVFLGIETPNPEALLKTNKKQNIKRNQENYLLRAVRKIQNKGLEVSAGFIVGLDGDREDMFDAQIEFVQQAGIPRAMVGLLTVIKGTNLYTRLQKEGRLLGESTGNNVDTTLNFIPEMDPEVLIEGYKRVLSTLYDPTLKNYFERCLKHFEHLGPNRHGRMKHIGKAEVLALARSLRRQLFSRQGHAYARFLARVLRHHPDRFADAVRFAIIGYHFEKITSQLVIADNFKRFLERQRQALEERFQRFTRGSSERLEELNAYARDLLARAQQQYHQIPRDVRLQVRGTFEAFQQSVRLRLAEFQRFEEVSI